MDIAARLATGGFVVDEVGNTRVVQRTFINLASIGDNLVVAARGAGIRIRVLAMYQGAVLANVAKFRSNATDISPPLSFAANGGISLPLNPLGWFQTAPNEALNLNLTAASAVGTMVIWVEAS